MPALPLPPCSAPKPALPDVGTFEDVLAQARQQAAPPPPAAAGGRAGGDATAGAADGAGDGACGAAAAVGGDAEADAEAAGAAADAVEADADDDLEFLDSDEEGSGDERLVELPGTSKKKKMPHMTHVGAALRCAAAVCCPWWALRRARVGLGAVWVR